MENAYLLSSSSLVSSSKILYKLQLALWWALQLSTKTHFNPLLFCNKGAKNMLRFPLMSVSQNSGSRLPQHR